MKNTLFSLLIMLLIAPKSWAIRNGEYLKHKNNNFMVYFVSGEHSCSGIRIAQNYVLTVAHCFPSKRGITVRWYEGGKRNTKRILYKDIKFLGKELSRELALIKIEDAGDYKPFKVFDYRMLQEDTLENYDFFGFGISTSSLYPGTLRKGAMNFKQEIEHGDDDNPMLEFARNKTKGQNPCIGDSGGPILKMVNQEYQLVGLVSFVDSSKYSIRATQEPKWICDAADQAFYIPVSEYMDELRTLMD